MMHRAVFTTAGAVAVSLGVLLGAGPSVLASPDARVQLADAAQMAAVKKRQELMKTNGANITVVADYLKGKQGTAAEAKAAAAKIGELAKEIPAAFETEASLDEMETVGKNRGKPEIWLNWEGFVESAKLLEDKSAALVAAIDSDDKNAIQAALGDMGKNGCDGCHNDFRGPRVE